jgi:hypothetical protein
MDGEVNTCHRDQVNQVYIDLKLGIVQRYVQSNFRQRRLHAGLEIMAT